MVSTTQQLFRGAAAARYLGITQASLSIAVRDGRIKRRSDLDFDRAELDCYAAGRRSDPRPAPLSAPAADDDDGPTDGSTASQLQRAKLRLTVAQAEAKELDNREKAGELIGRAGAQRALFGAARTIRDRVVNLPAELAPVLAACETEHAIQDVLASRLRAVLELVAAEFERRAADLEVSVTTKTTDGEA
jgi:hypothetical protein